MDGDVLGPDPTDRIMKILRYLRQQLAEQELRWSTQWAKRERRIDKTCALVEPLLKSLDQAAREFPVGATDHEVAAWGHRVYRLLSHGVGTEDTANGQ